jgi:hypothetical protein
MDGTQPHVALAENWLIHAVGSSKHPPREMLSGSIHNRGQIFSQTWKARSNVLNPIVQTTTAQPALEPATPTATGSDAHERQRPALPPVSRRQRTGR